MIRQPYSRVLRSSANGLPLEMEVGRHLSLFRVVTGQLQGPFVDIGPDDPLDQVRPDEVAGLLACLLP